MGLREGKKRKARQNIQSAAVQLFRERGFGGTRVREIIERVQISESTFFNYYATKDAVLNEWAHEKVASALARSSNGAYTSLREEITDRARRLAAEISDDRTFLMTVWDRLRLAPPSENMPRYELDLREFISARQSRGEIKEGLPADQVASLITSLAMGTISEWLTDRENQSENLEIRMIRALDMLFDGCTARTSHTADSMNGAHWAQAGAR